MHCWKAYRRGRKKPSQIVKAGARASVFPRLENQRGVKRGRVFSRQRRKLGHDGFVFFIVGQIFHFERVGVRIKQHRAVDAVLAEFGVAPLLRADGGAVNRFAVLAPDAEARLVPFRRRIIQQRHEACAFDFALLRQAAQFHQRRINVQRLHDARAALAVAIHAGRGNDQRHARAHFKQRAGLGPFSLFAKLIAVVTRRKR